jgi:O-antigen ligase
VLTISRAGIMTWILSIAAFFIGLSALGIISKRKFFRISVSFGLIICLALGITYLAAGRQLQDRMYDDSGSVAMRVPTFKVAFNVIRYNPIFGVGLRNYTLRHQEYDTTKEQISIRLPSSKVHNLFLLYASEIGIPGLLFFLWFLWGILKNSLFCAKHDDNTAVQAAFLGIALGVSSLIIQSFTGWGVMDRIIHLSIIAIFAGVSTKQFARMRKKRVRF